VTSSHYDVIVIGAGIHGLATAYHLLRLGCPSVAVLERWQPGHPHGSSHGKVRITRSTYASPDYVHLALAARREEWPRLEQDSGRTLILPRDGVFFGPSGPMFETYAAAVQQAGCDVQRVSGAEGRRRFPWFRFAEGADVLCDPSAGIVKASETISALADLIGRQGGTLVTDTRVTRIDRNRDPIAIETDQGLYTANQLVVTAGAWTRELLPFLKQKLQIARQNIGYFEIDGMEEKDFQRFPPWVYLEDGENNVYYGLPEIGEGILKIGRHLTAARDDDPEHLSLPVDADALLELRQFLERHLSIQVHALVKAEHCLYTNTATEDFIVDHLPDDRRMVLGSACSGHSFKFGPLVGRILAEIVLTGNSTVSEYQTLKDRWAIHDNGN
jgi:monomeric sarcosine oxidase